MKNFLVLFFIFAQQALGADLPAGQVVWWRAGVNRDLQTQSRQPFPFGRTTGIISEGGSILSNVVAVAAGGYEGVVLKTDGTIFSFSNFLYEKNLPAGLGNIILVMSDKNRSWAIKRDGIVAGWEKELAEWTNSTVDLSNVVAVVEGDCQSFLALKQNGTILSLRFDANSDTDGPRKPGYAPAHLLKVNGEIASNIVAMATEGFLNILTLKSDGKLLRLKPDIISNEIDPITGLAVPPYRYDLAEVVIVGNQILTNVTTIASGNNHTLALKSDGTIIGWGVQRCGASNRHSNNQFSAYFQWPSYD